MLPSPPLTDPDVQISRIRFFRRELRSRRRSDGRSWVAAAGVASGEAATGLQHPLPTLRMRRCRRPRKARFRLAGWPLPGEGRTLRIASKGFKASSRHPPFQGLPGRKLGPYTVRPTSLEPRHWSGLSWVRNWPGFAWVRPAGWLAFGAGLVWARAGAVIRAVVRRQAIMWVLIMVSSLGSSCFLQLCRENALNENKVLQGRVLTR